MEGPFFIESVSISCMVGQSKVQASQTQLNRNFSNKIFCRVILLVPP
jgi:hypothetical protein